MHILIHIYESRNWMGLFEVITLNEIPQEIYESRNWMGLFEKNARTTANLSTKVEIGWVYLSFRGNLLFYHIYESRNWMGLFEDKEKPLKSS